MARVLLAPRPLGGFSILQLPNLLIRKFPDPTALSVATLRAIYVATKRKDIKSLIIDILSPRLAQSRNYELLLENPTSLNLATPSSPSEGRRDILLKYFKNYVEDGNTWIKNNGFKFFLRDMNSNQEDC